MKQRLSSVVSPRLVLNLLYRCAQEENSRSASTEVGFYRIPGLPFKSRDSIPAENVSGSRDPGIANPSRNRTR